MWILPRIIELANSLAQDSDFHFRLGAIMFNHDRIIAQGYNSLKSHPFQKKQCWGNPEKIYLHAEIQALLRAKGKFAKNILVTRIVKNSNRFGVSRPCSHCKKTLFTHNITNIFFIDEELNLVKENIKSSIVMGSIFEFVD